MKGIGNKIWQFTMYSSDTRGWGVLGTSKKMCDKAGTDPCHLLMSVERIPSLGIMGGLRKIRGVVKTKNTGRKRTTGVCKLLCALALGAPVGAGADTDEARRLDISGWEGGGFTDMEDMGSAHRR